MKMYLRIITATATAATAAAAALFFQHTKLLKSLQDSSAQSPPTELQLRPRRRITQADRGGLGDSPTKENSHRKRKFSGANHVDDTELGLDKPGRKRVLLGRDTVMGRGGGSDKLT